jgi:hypothetical protein
MNYISKHEANFLSIPFFLPLLVPFFLWASVV